MYICIVWVATFPERWLPAFEGWNIVFPYQQDKIVSQNVASILLIVIHTGENTVCTRLKYTGQVRLSLNFRIGLLKYLRECRVKDCRGLLSSYLFRVLVSLLAEVNGCVNNWAYKKSAANTPASSHRFCVALSALKKGLKCFCNSWE